MKAFVLNRYGGPQGMGFRDLPCPTPGPDQLLVRTHSAGLNPVDYKFRQGKLWPIYHPKLPVVMGNELAGTVVGKGAAVSGFSVGDRIFVRGHKTEMGAFAEFACVPATLAANVPAMLDFDQAGGVPLAGLTALQVLRDELKIKSGMRLLIIGASGGVGTFAVQLAKLKGAEVTVTASPAGQSLVEALGADHVIDYTKSPIDQSVDRKFDATFDLVGGDTLTRSFRVVKPGGKIVSIAGIPEPITAKNDLGRGRRLQFLFWLLSTRLRWLSRRHHITYRYYFMHGSAVDLEQLAKLIEEKKLRVIVDRIFPFARIHEAFEYLEQGHAKGKVVVTME
jgi:NADPH:quinone reductase-like Zn-dependent oxidoreductase